MGRTGATTASGSGLTADGVVGWASLQQPREIGGRCAAGALLAPTANRGEAQPKPKLNAVARAEMQFLGSLRDADESMKCRGL